MLNNVSLMGRLTAAPELKSTNTGTAVTAFTLAVERAYAKQASRDRRILLIASRGEIPQNLSQNIFKRVL